MIHCVSVAIEDNGIEILLDSWNVQVLGLIHDEADTPFRRWNPDLRGNRSDVGGGVESSVDVVTESPETVILETQPSPVEGALLGRYPGFQA